LATAAIKMAVKKKMYVLDSSEKAIIDSLKNDNEKFYYLSGCIGMTIMVSHLSNTKKSDFKRDPYIWFKDAFNGKRFYPD
ncbi:MAG: hypothetical protein JNM67_00690, partial [Bacteroidetes bacterium]|nr:hypothetical protein [Bacteroidota bacterium]